MCGFAGYLISSDVDLSGDHLSMVREMADAIVSRGPDGHGEFYDQSGFAVAHRRLSVVDLSEFGAQPMVSHNRRWIIAFNGEIYNHRLLREELDACGHAGSWVGGSDTETLLEGFSEWGTKATLDRCVGMFAFAIWDTREKTLTLGRDRAGEKPIYYGWQNGVFLFGSELKALQVHPAFSAKISRDALQLYMRHACVPSPYCIYDGINKLDPGCLVHVSALHREPVVERYWSVAEIALKGQSQRFHGTAAEAVSSLEALLLNAVGLQMAADVPLGAFLSGGIDSSTVTALMQSQSSQPIRTFSIGFNEPRYNEAIHAKEVASHLGTSHTELYVSPEQATDVIPLLPHLYDEPFADSSQIPTFLVSKLARESVTVALSGDAGDEIFSGYNRYQLTAQTWAKLSVLPLPLRRLMSWGLTRLSPSALNSCAEKIGLDKRWADIGYKLHKGAGVLGAVSVDDLYVGLVSQWDAPSEVVIGGTEPSTYLTGSCPDLSGLSDSERMMVLDTLSYLPDDILTKVDRAAMGVSLESRVPFLDHRVIEFAWGLPLDYKLRNEGGSYVTKWILREVLYKYVPKKLIERPKMGFGLPIDDWLRGPLREWAEDLLDEKRLMTDGYFKVGSIREKWEEHLSGRRNWQHSLWCVLMFQSWLQNQSRSVKSFQ